MVVLYILGKIIIDILLVLIAVLMAILIIPFKYYINGEKHDTTYLNGVIAWLFGGLKMRFSYSSDLGLSMGMNFLGFEKNLKYDRRKKQNEPKDEPPKSASDKNKDKKAGYSYFKYDVLKKGLQSVFKMLNHCKPRQLCIDARIGFEDPMYTGLLCGIQNAGYAILDKYNIRLKTTFEDEVLEGSFIIGGGIQLFYLILVAIEFVFAKPFRSILFKNLKLKINRRLRRWRIVSILVKT